MEHLIKHKLAQYKNLPSPAYIIHEDLLEQNLKKINYIQEETGIKFLLALKAYSYAPTLPMLKKYLYGAVASGINEAKLAREYFGEDSIVETFSPAFTKKDFPEILENSNTVVFNSLRQLITYKDACIEKGVQIGIRLNLETDTHSPLENFSPTNPKSRFGIKVHDVYNQEINGVTVESLINDGTITYLHVHLLCESGYEGVEHIVTTMDEKIPHFLSKVQEVNFGGGVLYTHEEFETESFIDLIEWFWGKYPNIDQLYVEPGEASVYYSGVMTAEIVDIVKNGNLQIAILNASAQNHLLDCVLIPNFQPDVLGADYPHIKEHTYALSSNTCLSLDEFGEYSFDEPLQIGDKITFLNTSFYSQVTTSDFNGVARPSLIYLDGDGNILHQRDYVYSDFVEKIR